MKKDLISEINNSFEELIFEPNQSIDKLKTQFKILINAGIDFLKSIRENNYKREEVSKFFDEFTTEFSKFDFNDFELVDAIQESLNTQFENLNFQELAKEKKKQFLYLEKQLVKIVNDDTLEIEDLLKACEKAINKSGLYKINHDEQKPPVISASKEISESLEEIRKDRAPINISFDDLWNANK